MLATRISPQAWPVCVIRASDQRLSRQLITLTQKQADILLRLIFRPFVLGIITNAEKIFPRPFRKNKISHS